MIQYLKCFGMVGGGEARYPSWGFLPPQVEDTRVGGQDIPRYLHPRGASCQVGRDKLLHRHKKVLVCVLSVLSQYTEALTREKHEPSLFVCDKCSLT